MLEMVSVGQHNLCGRQSKGEGGKDQAGGGTNQGEEGQTRERRDGSRLAQTVVP